MDALKRVIAAAYKRAATVESRAINAWMALARHSAVQASIIRRDYLVIETDVGQPYADANEMFADLERGRIYISEANSEHPLWTVRDNVNFRLCHDVQGHYEAFRNGALADFSWEGEFSAFGYHAQSLPRDTERPGLLDALFTEVMGQAAVALTDGQFPDQKVAFLW
jgi:hypothetical protein